MEKFKEKIEKKKIQIDQIQERLNKSKKELKVLEDSLQQEELKQIVSLLEKKNLSVTELKTLIERERGKTNE